MGALELRNKLQELMNTANDFDLVRAFDEFVTSYKSDNGSVLTMEQKAELDRRVARHKAGEGKSYTWEEVKAKLSVKYGI